MACVGGMSLGAACVCVCVCLFAGVRGFNVDTENFVKHTGTPGSMFGFSVAEHKDRGVSWVLVGAPEAQTRQPGVTRGGAVYRCDVTRDDACQELPFDVTGNNNNSQGAQIDRKSEQWFGATVSSSGSDGVIVACAPRYVWFATSFQQREPVGTCYVAKNSFTDFSEYSPCRTRNWGHHRQGSCQVGLGAAVSKDGERLYLGAVGAWYWQGELFSMPSDVKLRYLPPGRSDFGAPGQVFSQSLTERPQFFQTREGLLVDDDSYLGYSVVAGDFDGSGEPGAAVGMPKGHGLEGKVVLYTWDLKNSQNITGEQIGGYFGYSLCTSDMDGDGLDDLIIGAPMFTAQTNNNEMKYETGRIYVVYQGTEDKFQYLHTRDGINSKGRFGLSLAGLGDINKDGYGDIAVGAPYDGPSERGAVYIYHGSKAGVTEKPSQVIFAEDIRPDIATFGFSLAGGLDLDNNAYPDVVVGAYESETAIFLKSRPVIKMNITLDFQVNSKVVSLKERNCTTRDKNRVTCFPLRGCLEYSGEGVDRSLDFEIQFLLDSKKTRDIRLFFIAHEGRYSQNYSIALEKGRRYCKTETVYIKSSIRDKLTPLEAELRYGLRSESARGSVSSDSRRVTRSLRPILDQKTAALQKDSINIEKNCGEDNICIPDLKLIARPSVDQYLLGSEEQFEIDVFVENKGEDAFEAVYTLQLPPGMNYSKVKRIHDFEQEIPVQCSGPSAANNYTLKCDIGNPLPKRKLVHFKVIMSPFHRAGMKSRYEFYMEVNTTNPENKSATFDNARSLSIPIWVQTEHIVSGFSYPSDVPYNMSQYRSANITTEADIGPQVVHIYSIKNQGPSDIVEAEAFFVWPSHTQEDDVLLYLLQQPQTNGPVRCDIVPSANALKLQLDSGKKNYLKLHGITTDSTYNSGVTAEHSSSSSRTGSSSFSSSSSSSAGSSVHTSSGEAYERNYIVGHRGGHTLTNEERNSPNYDSEEHYSGRRVQGGSGSGTSSHTSSHSSSASQGGGGRGHGEGQGGYSYEHNRTEEVHRQGGSGAHQGGSISGQGGESRNRGSQGQGSTATEDYNHSRGGDGRVVTSSQDGRVVTSSQDGRVVTSSQDGRVVTSSHDERVVTSSQDGRVITSSEGGRVVTTSQGGRESSSQGGSRNAQGGRDYDGRGSQGGRDYDGRGSQGGRDYDGRGSQGGRDYDGRGSQGGRDYDGRGSQGGRDYDGRGVQGGRDYDGTGAQGGRDRDYDERHSHSSTAHGSRVSQSGGEYDRRYSQSGSRTDSYGNIPVEEGAYTGSGSRGGVGRTKLEQDYGTFGSHGSQGGRDRDLEREEWRRAQASRAEWRANQGNRPSTGDYDSRGSQTYNQGGSYSREESRHYGQGGRDGSEYGASGAHNQGRGGDYDRDYYHGRDHNAGGSEGHHESSSSRSSSSSRTYSQGGSGDYSAGGTRISGHGGTRVIHEDYGNLGREGNAGSLGERTHHESRNFTATYSEDGGAPRRFSNFSFSNVSSGGDNVSGSWQSGDDLSLNEHLGQVGAGHSGSHETVSHTSSRVNYGDVRESNLERHGESGASRSGYNVGNPSSAERRNWSAERQTHVTGGTGGFNANGDGLAVFNWTNPVNNFGLHGTSNAGGRRTEGEYSQTSSRQWDEHEEYSGRDEPGLRRTHSRRESRVNSAGHGDNAHKTHSGVASSTSETSSTKTQHKGALQDIMGINSIHDVDSRFQIYNRFERSVRDLVSLNDNSHEEIEVRHRRSIDSEDNWNRVVSDEGYASESRRTSNEELDEVLKCSVPKCTQMRCVVGPLKKDEEVFIGLRYRVWVRTLEKVGWNQAAKLSTLMSARVTELPHVGEPFVMVLKTEEVPIEVFPTDVPVRPDIVPLWVVVLSACAGAIILLLLIFLLYKCGFFKRNRPSDSAEKQPLNRNGHYNSGDEAL